MQKSWLRRLTAGLSAAVLSIGLLAGCGNAEKTVETQSEGAAYSYGTETESASLTETPTATPKVTEAPTETPTPTPEVTEAAVTEEPTAAPTEVPAASTFDVSTVPAYSGSPYAKVNGNTPYFSDADMTTTSYETYGNLDFMGRCTTAVACIGQDLMPTEKRGDIGAVKPTGWHTVKYNGIDGNYLYNRCHLIGYQLTGENANTQNLITGTRYMNVEGMEPFENMTADYIKETGNHVLYRVTPVFEGNNLLASGVLMEAKSVEDAGAGILFCVYCYNVQPGITIDYASGDSSGPEFTGSDQQTAAPAPTQEVQQTTQPVSSGTIYIVNTNTGKFHYPDCSSVKRMSDANKMEYTGSRDDLIAQGYEPCKNCNP